MDTKSASRAFSKFCSDKVVSIHEVSKGADHYVFIIETAKKKYVLKKPESEKIMLFYEDFATRLCSRKKIPVPKVLYVSNFLIEEYLPGKDLCDISLPKKEAERVYLEIGRIMKKLHGIRLGGFGSITKRGRGKYANQRTPIQKKFLHDIALARKTSTLRELVPSLLSYYDKNKHFLDTQKSVLLHDDLIEENIRYDSKNVYLIDFGDLRAGPPAADFARLYVENQGNAKLKALFKGYGKIDEQEVRFYSFLFLTWSLANRPNLPKKRIKKRLGVLKELIANT